MLTKVSVVPPPGAYWPTLEIPVSREDGSGVFAEKVDGLEPVKAEITTNSYNELDGDFFIGSRVPKRNIVLHLIMGDRAHTVSQIRQNLYGYFSPKMFIVLQLDFDDRDSVRIEGYVEDFSGDRFSQDPDAAVSIICPKPNFKDITERTVNGNSQVGTDPPAEDALNDGDRMVGFELWISNNSLVDFEGDIKIQRLIESSPGVYFSTQELRLNGVSLPSGLLHYVKVNTKKGEKSAKILVSDDTLVENLLGKMADDSTWPELWAAMNKFRVVTTGTTGWSGEHLTWSLTYFYEYGGV